MSDLIFINADRTENAADAVRCVNAGCGILFDPARQGFNGECDDCAALTADHFCGLHDGMEFDCPLCWADIPVSASRMLVAVA
ncbi:hypothetical protein [Jatrophihabitans sp.]|uniref:hypothetical protein n=1 Tax=Jatrophihabitans sp. TaxID=1932789 RepID=UPI002C523463|nr:hypothetical protein [Jatrophihabitans sp.]